MHQEISPKASLQIIRVIDYGEIKIPQTIQVSKNKYGNCLIATRDIKKGQIVFENTVEIISPSVQEYRFSIQGKQFNCQSHFHSVKYGDVRYAFTFDGLMNHSCDQNTLQIPKDVNTNYYHIATRDIKAGEQLTCNYFYIDYQFHGHFFKCLCGSPKCHEKTNGFKNLSLSDQIGMLPKIDKEMRKIWLKDNKNIRIIENLQTLQGIEMFDDQGIKNFKAKERINKGEIIFEYKPIIINQNDINQIIIIKISQHYQLLNKIAHTIQQNQFGKVLYLNPFLSYGYQPNTTIVQKEGKQIFICIKDIQIGQKIICDDKTAQTANNCRPLVFIHNFLEDVMDTYRVMDVKEKQYLHQIFNTWDNENQIIGMLSLYPYYCKYYFISLNEIQESYLEYICELFKLPRNKIQILVPQVKDQLLGSISEYIIADKQLMGKLFKLGNFDILSYCLSEQYYLLLSLFQNKTYQIQTFKRQNWTKIKNFGTKSGFRQLITELNDQKIVLPSGKIFHKSISSYQQCVNEIVSNLKTKSVVIKIQKYAGGHGVVIFKNKSLKDLNSQELKVYIESRLSEPYWKLFDIVIEDFIQVDQSIGSSTVQVFINQQGTLQVVWLFSMLIANQTNYFGIQFSKQLFPPQIKQKMTYIGVTLGKIYGSLGYQGHICFDVLIDKSYKVYVSEANVRRSTPLYICNFLKHFNDEIYDKNYYVRTHKLNSEKMKNIKFQNLLKQIRNYKIEYSKQTKVGVILTNSFSFRYGYLQFFTITQNAGQAKRIQEKIFSWIENN